MASVTIRNLDAAVVDKLKARARRNNRSLEAELRALLTVAAHGPGIAELRALAERIAALSPAPLASDSVDLLREDGER